MIRNDFPSEKEFVEQALRKLDEKELMEMPIGFLEALKDEYKYGSGSVILLQMENKELYIYNKDLVLSSWEQRRKESLFGSWE